MKNVYCIVTRVNGQPKPTYFSNRKAAMKYASSFHSFEYYDFGVQSKCYDEQN